MTRPDLDAAAQFLAAGARILERRRFERLFRGGDAQPVRDALAAYRTADGGFGHGLEPDGRTPGAQPAAVQHALHVLDHDDAWDDDLVRGACDWLQDVAPEGGGATFVLPSVQGWPHAPWWQPEPDLPPSLTITGQLVAPLLRRGVRHPWVDRAVEVCWTLTEALEQGGPYELRGALAFLDEAPDRDRAQRALHRLAPLVAELVELDPAAPGETHGPLDVAPRPGTLSRTLLDPATVERHLDHLAAEQQDDGGWTFDWLAWSPAAAGEWRGVMTVQALATLQAAGRLGE